MRIPPLGPRGEGWTAVQVVLIFAIVVSGVAGPAWPDDASTALRVLGLPIAIGGAVLLIGGLVGIRHSMTPFPRPLEGARLQVGGAYRLVRHPIYGGLLLLAIGWSGVLSPIALVVTAPLAVVLELKARHEESMLAKRYPEYEAYRRRVRWRFVPGVR